MIFNLVMFWTLVPIAILFWYAFAWSVYMITYKWRYITDDRQREQNVVAFWVYLFLVLVLMVAEGGFAQKIWGA